MRAALVAIAIALSSCGGGGGGGTAGGGITVDVDPPGVGFDRQPSDGDLLDVITHGAAVRIAFVDVLGSSPFSGEVLIGLDASETAAHLAHFVSGTALLGVEARWVGSGWTYANFMAQLDVVATNTGAAVHFEIGDQPFPGAQLLDLVEVLDAGGNWHVDD